MNLIQTIFHTHADAFMKRHPVDRHTAKVIRAIQGCRTGDCGYHQYACPSCGAGHVAVSSCGNRHCPTCQNKRAADWVYQQQLRLLPAAYFMVTFTLPDEVREVAMHFPREVYDALLSQAADALRTLETDERFVGCAHPGFFGVLHTWGRQMQYHPHAHFIVAGGGLSENGTAWKSCRGNFLVHVRPLSILFRNRMREALARAGLSAQIPPEVWNKTDWVVHCQYVGQGDRALKYLGAYVSRVAISNARILHYDGQTVTLKYQKVGSSKWRRLTLDVMEFIRRYLMHVLPKGFVKVRHYGFLHPNFRVKIEQLREMICVLDQSLRRLLAQPAPPRTSKPLRCVRCQSMMKWIKYYSPLFVHAAAPPVAG